MAEDKPRFVDPLLVNGPPQADGGPPDPKARPPIAASPPSSSGAPAAATGGNGASTGGSSTGVAATAPSTLRPVEAPIAEPVEAELLDPKGLSVGSAAASLMPPATGERIPSGTSANRGQRRRLLAEKHAEAVQRVDSKIRMRAAGIVLQAMDAAQVLRPDEDETGMGSSKPEGWTRRHFRIALDARLPDKDAPAYIRHANRIYESVRRSEALEADTKPVAALNCDIQVVMKSEITYNYEIVEAKEE